MPTTATEIFHEGIQIPPIKLFECGQLNQGVMAIIARNSRTPDMMIGDLLALSAAGKIAEKRLQELCQKFGGDAVVETFAVLCDRARETMRRLISLLPEKPVFFLKIRRTPRFTLFPYTTLVRAPLATPPPDGTDAYAIVVGPDSTM